MRNVVIIKVYTDGRKKVMCGERKEGEMAEDAAKRIIRDNKLRNMGEFIVISRSGDEGAFIMQYMNKIDSNNSQTIIWIGDTNILIDALMKLNKEALRDAD